MSNISNDESNERLVDKIGQFITIPFSFIREAKELSFHARWLFVTLRFYTNRQSGNAFPSYETIQELTGMRREMIAKSIRELADKGWLTKRRRFSRSNLYTLNIPPLSANRQQSDIGSSNVSEGGEEAYRSGNVVAPRATPDYGIPPSELWREIIR